MLKITVRYEWYKENKMAHSLDSQLLWKFVRWMNIWVKVSLIWNIFLWSFEDTAKVNCFFILLIFELFFIESNYLIQYILTTVFPPSTSPLPCHSLSSFPPNSLPPSNTPPLLFFYPIKVVNKKPEYGLYYYLS